MNRLYLSLFCASLWLFPSAARAELVYTADGRALYGQVRVGAAATVVVDGGDGSPVTLRREEVSSIEFRPPAPDESHASSPLVVLRNGDHFSGPLRQLWPPAVSRGGATVVVPPSWVAAVRIKPGAAAGTAGELDVVELSNGDRVEGRVEGFRDGRLQVSAPIGALSIDPHRIRGLILARGDAPLDPAPGIQVTLETMAGERLTGEWLALTSSEIRLKPSWGPEMAVPLERATRLTVLNGRLVFLSDIHPTEVQETPFFDTPHPFRVDRSQGGRPLRLGGRVYARGLGVHARSALTYALAGSFKTFATTLGVDSEVGNGGSVIFRIVGDDKPLYESPIFRGGDTPLPVTVDVSGILLLRLEVDEAENADVADHADWAEARLMK
jgi:NPCBM/NEW2 domain-containing protein